MKKLLIGILAISLSTALIYGATSAWFTDATEVENTFTAGTVDISADDPVATITGGHIDNVNPGDEFNLEWKFINEGTKAIALRVIPEVELKDADGSTETLSLDEFAGIIRDSQGQLSGAEFVERALELNNNVTVHIDDDGTWYIIYNDPIPGTYTNEAVGDRTVTLSLTGTFDGAKMTNKYQGASITVTGTVQAIQASHSDEWSWADFESYNPAPSSAPVQ